MISLRQLKLLTRKLLVFAGELVILVREVSHGLAQTSQFLVEAGVLTLGDLESVVELIHTSVEFSVGVFGSLQPLGQVVSVGLSLFK